MISKFGTFEYALADRYRFDAELGRGAMGTVYRARDVRLDRPVAIKMLHATLTNELGVARFQSEIRIAASLHHPNIVSVHDSGEADGRLFYVMDYLGGETLRTRLQREKQLSVDDALVIVEQIAEGLQFAHDRGVVHRDIKPENILLTDGIARVVDFGLARALGDVDTERLTASGLSVGTPQYLSPEQAAAEKDVGPRADQYGLACVLYEMLAGEPPFTGPTATAVAMRHISEVPSLLRNRRRTTPASFEAAVARALEKVPADRFGSVREFAAALSAPVASAASSGAVVAHRRARRLGVPSVMALAVLSVAVVGMIGAAVVRLGDPLDNGFRWLTNRSLDTTRYVVLPFTSDVGAVGDAFDDRLRDALSHWTGVSVVGAAELRSALGDTRATLMSAGAGRGVARTLGAGRFVVGAITKEGGAIKIRAEALDATGRQSARSAIISISNTTEISDTVVSGLAYRLLFANEDMRANGTAARGTANRLALSLYLHGEAAAGTWNLPKADSDFTAALRLDSSFPQALLALASVRSWERDQAQDVGALVRRALDAGVKLSANEQAYAKALDDLASSRPHDACVRFESLVASDSASFGAWYGLGQCNLTDRAVVPDRRSPRMRQFRSSRNRAIFAFGRAFDILPSIDSCCVRRAMDIIQHSLILSATQVALGHGLPPDTKEYGAYPELLGDTIALIPMEYGIMAAAPPGTRVQAVDRMRDSYFAFAARRLAMYPQSPDALETLGEAMDLRGDQAAVDTIHKARIAAKSVGELLSFGTIEVWIRLKYAAPSNLRELAAARLLADSLLKRSSESDALGAGLLASLASLVGDANLASSLASRADATNTPDLPPTAVTRVAKSYLALASMGGPVDSLEAIENRLASAIQNGVLPSRQAEMRNMLIGQAAGLAYPVYHSARFSALDSRSDYLLAAEMAHARRDTDGVRRILDAAARRRVNIRPADLTLDAIYPEAWLLASIGDSTAALRLVSSSLDALRGVPARRFADVASAGALVQMMILRATLATTSDRASATVWAKAVRTVSDSSRAIGRARIAEISKAIR